MKRIWVIDDDLAILEVVKIVLNDAGYDVLTISDVNILRNEIKRVFLPDLILLDIWMNGKDGCDVAKYLKKNNLTKDIRIIMISALSETQKIAKESKADDFLRKPFDMNDLLKIVKKYV